MNWRLKILRGVVHSQIPFAIPLRRFKRKIRPITEESGSTHFAVQDGIRQIACLRRAGCPMSGTFLEMGTGWLPVIPLLFFVAGFGRFILTDLERLMDDDGIAVARKALLNRLPMVAEGLGMSEAEVAARLEEPFVFEYHAPWNLIDGGADGVDVLISRCVFEHVPPAALEACLRAFRSLVKPAGWMCHVVDNSDHWQHNHLARSRVEFLTWREGGLVERFARLDQFGYTNRLRHSDYRVMFRETGWTPVLEVAVPDDKVLDDLCRLRLATPFQHYDLRDLAVLDSTFVLRPAS